MRRGAPVYSRPVPEPVRRNHFIPQATPADVYAVVVDFPAYPRLFPEITAVQILQTEGKRVRAGFDVQVVLAARYVLDLICDPQAHTVDWTFVEGKVVSNSVGSWRFTAEGGGTRVDYAGLLEVNAPGIPGFIKRKIESAVTSATLPAMFASITREVTARRARATATAGG
jgi:ribosome-associated toxin RatA of RatAB toxin-antitoxin module